VSLVLSTAINLWLGIGSVVYGRTPKLKPMNTYGCEQNSTTFMNLTTPFVQVTESSSFFYLNETTSSVKPSLSSNTDSFR
jgi:hypothetical protein